MFTNHQPKRGVGGFSLVEVLVAMGAGGMLLAVLASLVVFFARGFLVTSNCVRMNTQNRLALDRLSRDIRQADRVTYCSASELRVKSGLDTIRFEFDSDARVLSRVRGNDRQALLRDCDYIRFDLFQRNSSNGTYNYYPAAGIDTAKIVQVAFASSLPVYGTSRTNRSGHQMAKIVIRKQK